MSNQAAGALGWFWELFSCHTALAALFAVGSTCPQVADSEGFMKSVKWTAYGCFGLAGLSVILAMANEAPGFLGVGVGVLVMGIGFLAADRGLSLLTDIRDALVQKVSAPDDLTKETTPTPRSIHEPHAEDTPKLVRTAAEISADLKRLQENI